MKEVTEEYIDWTIKKLQDLKVDLYEYGRFSDRYNRYLDKFEKAKKVISYSNDVSSLFPLENPRELIYKIASKLDKDEQKKFLRKYSRKKVDKDLEWEFYNLDRLDNWRPPKS